MTRIPSHSLQLDSPWRVTFLVDGAIQAKRPPVAVIERDKGRELVSGYDIHERVYRTVEAARKQAREVLSSALLRTEGGSVNIGTPVTSTIGFLDYEGIPSTAFVNGYAGSFGAQILVACKQRVSVMDAALTWHQTYHRINKKMAKDEKPPLARPREEFRHEFISWLEQECSPEYLNWAVTRATEAFENPLNHLDDVDFEAWELKRAGIIDSVVADNDQLSKAYARKMKSDPRDWHPRIHKFFD